MDLYRVGAALLALVCGQVVGAGILVLVTAGASSLFLVAVLFIVALAIGVPAARVALTPRRV